MSTKQTRFIVAGAGEFPFDMLRYDSCFPHDQTDAWQIRHEEQREVTLIHRHIDSRKWRPTIERWRSFGWVVIEIDGERQYRGAA